MKKLIFFFTFSFFSFAFSGCDVLGFVYNGIESSGSQWADTFVLYVNGDIRTMVLPFSDSIGAYTNIWEKYASSKNVLEAQYIGESHTEGGTKSFKMGWDGSLSETFDGGAQVNNVAFWLNTTNNGTGKDFSSSGYTKMSLWAKVTELAPDTEIVINVFGHTYPAEDLLINSSNVKSGWVKYEFDISSYSNSYVDTYLSVTIRPTGGALPPVSCGGATIYLDDIRLTK